MSLLFVSIVLVLPIPLAKSSAQDHADFRREQVVPFLAFLNTDDIDIEPPNLFADPEVCYKKKLEFGFKCYTIFIWYLTGPFDMNFNISKGMTTNYCLHMATKHDQTTIGYEILQNNTDSWNTVLLWHRYFKDYFKVTSDGTGTVGHFKTISRPKPTCDEEKTCFFKVKRFVAETYDKFKSKNLIQIRGLTDAQVLDSNCRIYGYKVSEPAMNFEPFSVPVKLLSPEDCKSQQVEPDFVNEGKELCIDNRALKLCHKFAEGAPIICNIDNKNVLVGLANKRRYFGKNQQPPPPIIMTKLYKDDKHAESRNNAVINQKDISFLYAILLLAKYTNAFN